MKIKDSFSLKVVDDYMCNCHKLRLKINRNHESGLKGSFQMESVLLDEYYENLQALVDYLEEK